MIPPRNHQQWQICVSPRFNDLLDEEDALMLLMRDMAKLATGKIKPLHAAKYAKESIAAARSCMCLPPVPK